MKRVFTLLMIASLALPLTVGCGKKTDKKTKTTKKDETKKDETKKDETKKDETKKKGS